jgi:hypothetical protein
MEPYGLKFYEQSLPIAVAGRADNTEEREPDDVEFASKEHTNGEESEHEVWRPGLFGKQDECDGQGSEPEGENSQTKGQGGSPGFDGDEEIDRSTYNENQHVPQDGWNGDAGDAFEDVGKIVR